MVISHLTYLKEFEWQTFAVTDFLIVHYADSDTGSLSDYEHLTDDDEGITNLTNVQSLLSQINAKNL